MLACAGADVCGQLLHQLRDKSTHQHMLTLIKSCCCFDTYCSCTGTLQLRPAHSPKLAGCTLVQWV